SLSQSSLSCRRAEHLPTETQRSLQKYGAQQCHARMALSDAQRYGKLVNHFRWIGSMQRIHLILRHCFSQGPSGVPDCNLDLRLAGRVPRRSCNSPVGVVNEPTCEGRRVTRRKFILLALLVFFSFLFQERWNLRAQGAGSVLANLAASMQPGSFA